LPVKHGKNGPKGPGSSNDGLVCHVWLGHLHPIETIKKGATVVTPFLFYVTWSADSEPKTGVLNKCMPLEHATTLQIGKLRSLRDPCDQ
jgi:hypothetical protein